MKYPTVRAVFDRKHVATKQKKGLVQLEVMYAGKRKWISTGIKLYVDQWKEKCMVCLRQDAMILNEQINVLMNNIREWIIGVYKNGDTFSFEKLDQMLNQVNEPDSFIVFIEKRIAERKIAESTRKQHYVMLQTLKEFGLIRFFSDINMKNIKLFDDYIKRKVSTQSSVYGYHKRLKIYVREAYELEKIKKNPYEGFTLPRGETMTRKYLERDELEKIEQVSLVDGSISNVRDCFIFCCYTGLAYADLAKFSWNEITEQDGKKYIQDVRQKTGVPYKIQILSPAMRILEKHNFKLPIISNQQYNLRLKVLASYAGINKPLTSHMARHSRFSFLLKFKHLQNISA